MFRVPHYFESRDYVTDRLYLIFPFPSPQSPSTLYSSRPKIDDHHEALGIGNVTVGVRNEPNNFFVCRRWNRCARNEFVPSNLTRSKPCAYESHWNYQNQQST